MKDIFDKSHGVQEHGYINEEEHGDAESDTQENILDDETVGVTDIDVSREFQKNELKKRF